MWRRSRAVSVGTVSKALNGRGQLREQTRERVRAAAEQLGFEPNTVARSLLAGRTYTVGLITTDHYGRFSIPLMRGAEDALGAGEMAALHVREPRGPDPRAALRAHAAQPPRRRDHRRGPTHATRGRRWPSTSRSPWSMPTPRPPTRPTARWSATRPRAPAPPSSTCSRPVVRRIAHVTGPPGHHSALVRAESFEATLAAHGVEPAGGRVWFGAWSEIWGRQAAQGLVAADRDIDAVFCGSDQIARGVADGLRECGLEPARGRRAGRRGQLGGARGELPAAADHDRPQARGRRANGRRAAARGDRRPPDRRHARHRSQARGPRVLGTAGPTGERR